ncbi:hypothetical protein [uncultured Bacteroides sp.]|uniref:hypothetical protein n=1 Tax=uncultured Bacteroides sp. TaxID=162156 RepID=UPI0026761F60|nr:hypothetical protein [uncultured Bacteroides sp.]
MNIKDKTKECDLLQRIVNHLTIQNITVHDIGLLNGKMGIAFFFYHYARYKKDSLYEVLAGNLMDEICDNLHDNMPITIDKGLCGIAWGICTLLEQDFLDGDADEVLNDIDYKIMERDPMRMIDFSFRTGLEGVRCYVQARLSFAEKRQTTRPFDNMYIYALEKSVQKAGLPLKSVSPLDVITPPQLNETIDILKLPLGLDGGCAGLALKTLYR